MSCLIYGLVFSSRCQVGAKARLALPLGVGSTPVRLVEDGRIAAAVTTIDSAALAQTVESAMAYMKVVEALHADRTVLPMRYGCVVDGDADVIQLLHARGDTYAEVLRDLDGCVEMGIRILAGQTPSCQKDRLSRVCPTGTAYLTWRTGVYKEVDRSAHQAARLSERIRSALDGLFVRCKVESGPTAMRSAPSVPLFTLHFLVRRGSVESFRQVFRRISRAEYGRFLLSGPWPPYNFVGPGGR